MGKHVQHNPYNAVQVDRRAASRHLGSGLTYLSDLNVDLHVVGVR